MREYKKKPGKQFNLALGTLTNLNGVEILLIIDMTWLYVGEVLFLSRKWLNVRSLETLIKVSRLEADGAATVSFSFSNSWMFPEIQEIKQFYVLYSKHFRRKGNLIFSATNNSYFLDSKVSWNNSFSKNTFYFLSNFFWSCSCCILS